MRFNLVKHYNYRNSDAVNREFLARLNQSGEIHMIPSMVAGKYVIRFCVTYEHAQPEHIGMSYCLYN